MLNSNERMSFIVEYMSAYEEKIKMANKYGLFDTAKMFELFAIEVCNLWFGQKFRNLNVETATYPYVDLISENRKLLIQVSTVQNVPAKIKATLEKIRDSKDKKYSVVDNVVFFVLDNDSIGRIKEYSGNNQIGSISFTIKDNLITTADIITKAQNNLDFQKQLYNVLKEEFESFNVNEKGFYDALEFSRNVGLKNIDGLINGEYEIDRNEFLEVIKRDNERYISIQGEAGSGKSVLCKKYVEKEELVLYARAERFIEESNIDNIWQCCVNDVLECLNGKKIFFLIDALEFIADSPNTKFELLQYLYDISSKYQNVHILTSCRTSDKNAFIKLETNFLVKIYEIGDIAENELILLMEKYPVIRKMYKMNSYVDLLKSPFYINLIVSDSLDIDKIGDENSLREYIWQNIICLNEKSSKLYGIPNNKILEAIEKIVFERAKKFSLGIYKDDIDGDIVHALLSEGVIVQQGEYIRLKYDVFEDICFENYFDKVFDLCKGKYETFYNEIESLGRCVYRRYQIWISNKLFIQSNRDKFLFSLIFTNEIPQDWKRQTEIGIVKSRFCDNFFQEQGLNALEYGLLFDFVKNINLFAFEAKLLNVRKESPLMQLTPIGNGRQCIIQLLKKESIYKQNIISRDDIIKLCLDYAKQEERVDESALAACAMMEYYVECSLQELEQEGYYRILDEISLCMEVLYRMAGNSEEWLKEFFNTLVSNYINGNKKSRRMSEDIMEWTLKNAYPALVISLSRELCLIADVLWLRGNVNIEEGNFYHSNRLSNDFEYGLSEKAENHNYSYRTVHENVFLWNVFRINFKMGFEWAIQFVNRTVLEYEKNNPEHVMKIKLKFDEKDVKEYWGSGNMWIAGIRDYSVPTLIGDVIFCLKEVIIDSLEAHKNESKLISVFANYIKDIIYSKSNNIALLTIIESIGMHFENELPGYALDLVTSIEIVYWDTSRYILYMKNPTNELLERQILMTVGIPDLKDRYELDAKCNLSIQEYVSHTQIYFDSIIRDKCYRILDYLYTIIKNDVDNAQDYLQIQKMDMRDAKETKITESITMLEPKITGEAKKVVQRHEETNKSQQRLNAAIKKCNDNMISGQVDLSSTIDAIEIILELMEDTDMAFQYENLLILLIASAIKHQELKNEKREKFCKIWLVGIQRLFSNGSFLADTALIPILLDQLEKDVDIEIKSQIKKVILNCLVYKGQHGVIDKIAKYVKEYLFNDKPLAQAVFNTIIKLAEDEMEHQKYNAKYLKMNRKDKDFVFNPNMQPKLSWVDRYIKDDAGDYYTSHKEEIIDRYLIQEEYFDIDDFDMSNYDISTIFYVANCGLNFESSSFRTIISKVLLCMIDIWNYNKRSHNTHKIFNTFQEHEIVEMFQREMIQTENDAKTIIDILFDGIDFTKFTSDTIEFYQNIFGNFLCEFFDSYVDLKRRSVCKKKILYIEKKVNNINEECVRIQLYKSLMFSVTMYCSGDWRKCITNYSYIDKQFLNVQFTKYGKYHIKELLRTIYQMHVDELLPEILVSIRDSFQNAKSEVTKFRKSIKEQEMIVQLIILKSFTAYSDKIKQDQELIEAYEGILEILVNLNYEQAAVILDEFRIH